MSKPVIDPKKSYTFSDYFKLNPPVDKLAAYFGYQHQLNKYILPQTAIESASVASLKSYLDENLQHVYLTNETARRETLVAPVVLALAKRLNLAIRIEHPLEVSKQLKGKIDYYLQYNNSLLIIEAKHDDLPRGFTQLMAELIALDQWLDEGQNPLYGAVTIGNIWQFGILDRTTKVITQDINLYPIPADLEKLLGILIAILEGK